MKIRRSAITAILAAAAAMWGTTVVLAVGAIRRFESTPGAAAIARTMWPSDSRVARVQGAPTLVMLVHPHCSCSRASVEELGKIVQRAPHSMRTYVLVYRPSAFPKGWEQTDVFRAAASLPRTQVVIDENGVEAKRFGGFTSGQTFLYDGDGRLRFSGGITVLRGHAGENRGEADVIRLASAPRGTGTHPVFGCAIDSRTEGGTR
ncbi:MAG TPA: RedB protein [Thermoanaerobaculia bacterium]|nr:RedB protein [Thermoanaerobaculia bacterium]